MRLSDVIAERSHRAHPPVRLRTGVVEGSTSTRCTVQLAGSSIAVPYLSTYAPVVGDNVLLLHVDTQLVVIGRVAR